MAKRLKARTGTYTNKDGKECGQYVDIGVILSNDKGEYALLNPDVSISGALSLQNVNATKEGKPLRDMVMCSIFDDSQQQGQSQGQAGQQQNQQQSQQQAPQQNSGFDNGADEYWGD